MFAQAIPYAPHHMPYGPMFVDTLGYTHPVEDVNNVSNEYLDIYDSDSSSHRSHAGYRAPTSERSDVFSERSQRSEQLTGDFTAQSFHSVTSEKASNIATASPSETRAAQLDLTSDAQELQMRYEAHMHETVEERTARLERKRRRLAAEASGSSLPPPAAVWNNSDWEHEQQEAEEDEDDGKGVGLW